MTYEPLRPAGLPPLPKIKQMAMLVDVDNFSQLDLYAQIILRELPDDAHANLACAFVAKQFGLEEKFTYCYKKAKLSDRSIVDLAKDLHIDASDFELNSSRVKQDNYTKSRYHLIKAWGYGFGSEMAALMGQACLAEAINRIPVIHWGANFLYRNGGSDCVFHHFFKPFNDLTIDDLAHIDSQEIFPPKWNEGNLHMENNHKREGQYGRLSALYFLNRAEQLTVADYYAGVINIRPWLPQNSHFLQMNFDQVYQYLADKYLRPIDEIQTEVDRFVATHLANGYLAVHARGSDKDEGYRAMTSIPGKMLEHAKKVLATMPKESKLFLMTDDQTLLTTYQNVFKDRLVFTNSQRSFSKTGVHYDSSTNKLAAGKEMLIDMLIAAKANYFIGLGLSNPSQLIYYFGNFSEKNYILFGENRLKQFNTHLYKTISVT